MGQRGPREPKKTPGKPNFFKRSALRRRMKQDELQKTQKTGVDRKVKQEQQQRKIEALSSA